MSGSTYRKGKQDYFKLKSRRSNKNGALLQRGGGFKSAVTADNKIALSFFNHWDLATYHYFEYKWKGGVVYDAEKHVTTEESFFVEGCIESMANAFDEEGNHSMLYPLIPLFARFASENMEVVHEGINDHNSVVHVFIDEDKNKKDIIYFVIDGAKMITRLGLDKKYSVTMLAKICSFDGDNAHGPDKWFVDCLHTKYIKDLDQLQRYQPPINKKVYLNENENDENVQLFLTRTIRPARDLYILLLMETPHRPEGNIACDELMISRIQTIMTISRTGIVI